MDITSQLDGLYWGVILSTFLFGITIVQTWIYVNNNNDKWHLRLLVTIMIPPDLATTCLNFQVLRYYLMINFGNPEVFSKLTRTFIAGIAITDATAYLTELFFVSRLYLLNKNNLWPPVIVTLFATAAFGIIAGQVDSMWKDPIAADIASTKSKIQVGIGLGLVGIADLITTFVLFRQLTTANTRIQIKRTQTILQNLILWVVTRCLLVTVNQVTLLVVYVIQPKTLHCMPFLMFEPKLHVITMMAMLNARTPRSQNKESDTAVGSLSFASVFRRSLGRANSLINLSAGEDFQNVKLEAMDNASLPDVEKNGGVLNIHPSCAAPISQEKPASFDVETPAFLIGPK